MTTFSATRASTASWPAPASWRELDATHATRWRWNRLTQRLADGLVIADLLNALGPSSNALPAIETNSLRALHQIANARRVRRGTIRRTA